MSLENPATTLRLLGLLEGDIPRIPRNDAELHQLLERTQRLLDEQNARRFRHQPGEMIQREAARRGCDALLSRDDSLPGGFRIRFVPRHVPASTDPETPGLLRKQAD